MLIENRMQGAHFSDEIAQRLVDSDETLLYYLTLAADRQIAKLKHWNDGNQVNKGMPPLSSGDEGSPAFWKAGSAAFWDAFNAARSAGNTDAMTQAVMDEFKLDNTDVMPQGNRREIGEK